VARHEARGVETRQAVAVALREQQAHERLQSGDEEGVRFEAVPFIESGYLAQLHPRELLQFPRLQSRHAGIMAISSGFRSGLEVIEPAPHARLLTKSSATLRGCRACAEHTTRKGPKETQ